MLYIGEKKKIVVNDEWERTWKGLWIVLTCVLP
jgi:hypothetical protein